VSKGAPPLDVSMELVEGEDCGRKPTKTEGKK